AKVSRSPPPAGSYPRRKYNAPPPDDVHSSTYLHQKNRQKSKVQGQHRPSTLDLRPATLLKAFPPYNAQLEQEPPPNPSPYRRFSNPAVLPPNAASSPHAAVPPPRPHTPAAPTYAARSAPSNCAAYNATP